jgi:Na+(H+)/acetate symporter ActP
MKANIGTTDRVIRILVAIAISVLYFANQISGTTAIVLLLVAALLVATSFIGTCLLYLPFGISTKRKQK